MPTSHRKNVLELLTFNFRWMSLTRWNGRLIFLPSHFPALYITSTLFKFASLPPWGAVGLRCCFLIQKAINFLVQLNNCSVFELYFGCHGTDEWLCLKIKLNLEILLRTEVKLKNLLQSLFSKVKLNKKVCFTIELNLKILKIELHFTVIVYKQI